MVCVAWNSAGTKVASGWTHDKELPAESAIILDANGKQLHTLKDVAGDVYGVAFVPDSDTLLVGANKLTAINSATGAVVWANDIAGAQAFVFHADGKTAAAGGWGKRVGRFSLSDGKEVQKATFDSVIGGLAFLPNGDLAIAVWGGTKPLSVLRAGADKPDTLFKSRFGFQNVVWSKQLDGVVAAEQGGNVWLLGADGQVKANLDSEAGTTIYRLLERDGQLLVGRMNRVVQMIKK
jgi:hypothetical protein